MSRLMFVRSRRFWKWTGTVLGAVIVLQLLFPYDRAFPGARVDGQPVSLKSKQDIESQLKDRYQAAVVVTTNPDTKTSFRDVGVRVDAAATAQRVVTYPVWQRLIPFSSIVRGFSGFGAAMLMTPVFSALYGPQTGVVLCLKEPRIFDLWLARMSKCPRVRNYRVWGCNSYRP